MGSCIANKTRQFIIFCQTTNKGTETDPLHFSVYTYFYCYLMFHAIKKSKIEFSTIGFPDHYPVVHNLIAKFPVKRMCVPCDQKATKPGKLRQRVYI